MDQRRGMLAPLAGSVTVTTPGGQALTTTARRSVTLAVPADLLSLRTQTDTRTINGRISSTTFDAPSRTLTATSAVGRPGRTVLDDRGRPVRAQVGDFTPVSYAYDARGRLASTTQGGRASTLAYDGNGFLAGATDPLRRTVAFTHDADGRVTDETLPDGRFVRFAYDLNGNLTALTPPGRSDHTVSYTPRDEIDTYSPPPLGAENDREGYAYSADRQPLRVDRADGQTVQFQFDAAGRLSTLGLA